MHHGAGSMNVRRPSAISISSLQRPSLPLKLDLSSSSTRIASEEGSGMYSSGLASPVTLAPKSARPIGPNGFPEEFMAVIDLTLAENDGHQIKNSMDPTAGDSSDKPIELDLDMDMDMSMNGLFSDNPEASNGASLPSGVDNMFAMTGSGGPDNKTKETDFIDLTTQDILATLSSNSMNATQNFRNPDPSVTAEAPSPATMLSTGFSQHLNTSNSLENTTGLSGTDQSFDMAGLGDLGDLSAFNSTSEFSISDMDAFLSMGTSGGGSGGGSSGDNAAKGVVPPEQSSAI